MLQQILELRNYTTENHFQCLALSMGAILNILKRAQINSGTKISQIKFMELLSMVLVMGKVSVGLPVILQQVHR